MYEIELKVTAGKNIKMVCILKDCVAHVGSNICEKPEILKVRKGGFHHSFYIRSHCQPQTSRAVWCLSLWSATVGHITLIHDIPQSMESVQWSRLCHKKVCQSLFQNLQEVIYCYSFNKWWEILSGPLIKGKSDRRTKRENWKYKFVHNILNSILIIQ